VHPGDVYVLWQEIVFSGGSHGGEIFFARSLDGGVTFGAPLNLSSSIAGDGKGRVSRESWHNGSLDLAIGSDGTLYAAWTEYEGPLWVTRSEDRGRSFATPGRVAGGGPAEPARAPALAVGPDDRVYLAWTVGEERNADVRIATSSDGGRTFAAPTIVARTKGYSDAPKVAVDHNGTVHLVHGESAAGPLDRQHVRYTRSRDGARTFEPARVISGLESKGMESEAFPALGLDGEGNVYLLWETYPDRRAPPRGLAIAHSRDGGETFGAPEMVPGSSDPRGGVNGSMQGMLTRKLAVDPTGALAVVNSAIRRNEGSRVWLMRGTPGPVRR
jgi:hypothetical protein